MFTLDTTIDTIQSAKKQFVNTVFAKQEGFAKALNQFVDAQTAYTKEAVKAGTEVATKLGTEATKMAQDVSKFDFTKAYEQFAKTFQAKK